MNTYNQSELFTMSELMNVFVISDHHFYHENIIRYCNRPFKDIKHMHNEIINKWNSVVKDSNTVLHLGDFSFGSKKMVSNIREKLNGKIYMIKGNHDKHGLKWYSDTGIMMIKNPFMIGNFLFSHASKYDIEKNIINIHGHSHNKVQFIKESRERKWYNISVENINYTPIRIGDLIKI